MSKPIEFEPLLDLVVYDGTFRPWVVNRDDMIRHMRRLNWEYLGNEEWRESEGENEDYSHLCAGCPSEYDHDDLLDDD